MIPTPEASWPQVDQFYIFFFSMFLSSRLPVQSALHGNDLPRRQRVCFECCQWRFYRLRLSSVLASFSICPYFYAVSCSYGYSRSWLATPRHALSMIHRGGQQLSLSDALTHTLSYYSLGCHGVTSSLITPLISCSNLATCRLLAKSIATISQLFFFFFFLDLAKVCVAVSVWSASPQSSSGRIVFRLLLSATAQTKCSTAIWNGLILPKLLFARLVFCSIMHGGKSNCWHSSWAPHHFDGHQYLYLY